MRPAPIAGPDVNSIRTSEPGAKLASAFASRATTCAGLAMGHKTRDAVEILHRRYYEGRPDRLLGLEQERLNVRVGQQIYDLRTCAGLSQASSAATVRYSTGHCTSGWIRRIRDRT